MLDPPVFVLVNPACLLASCFFLCLAPLPFRALSQSLHLGSILVVRRTTLFLPVFDKSSRQTAKTQASLPTSTAPSGSKPSAQGKRSPPLGGKYPRGGQQIVGARQTFWGLLKKKNESFYRVDKDRVMGRHSAETHRSLRTPAYVCLGHQGSELGKSLREVKLPLACAGHMLPALFFPMRTAALLGQAL